MQYACSISNKWCSYSGGLLIDLLEAPFETELALEPSEAGPVDTHYIIILDQYIDLAADTAKAAEAMDYFALTCPASVSANLTEYSPCGAGLQTGAAGDAGRLAQRLIQVGYQ